LVFVIVLGIFIYFERRDVCFQLVFIWALIGIIIKRVYIAEELVLSTVVTAVLGILILVFYMLYLQFKD
ncbi:MAG: hypothetical protein ACOCQB_02825, partial [Halanaerobiaceae bacterium]